MNSALILAEAQKINSCLLSMRSKNAEKYNSLLQDAEKKIFIRKIETSLLLMEFGGEVNVEELKISMEENKDLIQNEILM